MSESKKSVELNVKYNEKKGLGNSSSIGEHLEKIASKSFGNQLFIGTSGCGKSYASKLEIKKAIKAGKQVIVIDFQGEYTEFAEKVGHTRITLSGRTKNIINPLEIHLHNEKKEEVMGILTEKITDVCNVVETMIRRNLNKEEKKVLIEALEHTYGKYGITSEGFEKDDATKKMPTLTDLDKELRKHTEGIGISDEISPYIDGYLTRFNGERNVFIYETPIILFDLKNCDKDVIDTSLLIVLQFIYDMMKKGTFENTLLIIPQAWMLLNKSGTEYLTKILKSSKNHHTEVIVINQTLKDFFPKAKDVLDEFQTKVYFRQIGYGIEELEEHSGLSEKELSFLRIAENGECLVQMENDLQFFMKFEDNENTDRQTLYKIIY